MISPQRLTRALTIAGSLLLACLVLGAQVAAVTHGLDTQHSVCDEHGELIHGDSSARTDASGPTSTDVLAALPEEEHEHGCALLTGLSQSSAPPPQPIVLAIPTPPATPAPLPASTDAPACSAPLAFAPKTSPPTV
ncbi:MAG: hypothetical protein GY898_34240 [Proteobacteria bacterium]|nr:hypothetical protein [Pseudomonadota bacterium]